MRHQRQKYQDRTRGFSALALLLLVTMLAGCSDSPKTTAPSAAPPARGIAVQKQPIASASTATTLTQAEEKPADAYTYHAAGRRDPFAPIIMKQEKKASVGDRPPLERYNISEFKLTGIVWGGFGYNAMVEGPDGKGYFIRVGTILGPNRGVVRKITQNMMVIEETFKNFAGETEHKEIIIELRKKQEERP